MAIVIDLQVSDKGADNALDRLDSVLEKLQSTQDRLNDSLKATAQNANQAANSYGKMASNANRAGTSVRSVTQGQRRVAAYYSAIAGTDPAAALRYAQGQLAQDPYDAAAIRLKNRAQRALNMQNPANQLAAAQARTRYTPGGAGLPLGFDLLKHGPQLFGTGMAGMGGGIANVASQSMNLAGTGIFAAIAGLAIAMQKAAEYIGSVGRSVASAGNVQGLEAYSEAGGFGSASGGARSVQAAIQSGFGAGYAQQAGINIVGGPGGDNDYGGKLRKALKFIANSNSMDQARRRAEGLGIPEAANLYNSSQAMKDRIGKPINPLTTEDVRAANDFQIAMSRLAELFKNSFGRMISHDLELIAMKVTFVTDALEKFFKWLDSIYAFIADKLGIKSGNSPKDANTKAVEDNTRALKDFRETLGGGPRASGAIPKGINGVNFGHARDMRLGAI